MAIQFQENIEWPSHIKISVCSMPCADNATTSENLKLRTENWKKIKDLVIFLAGTTYCNFLSVLWRRNNSKNCIGVRLENSFVYPQLKTTVTRAFFQPRLQLLCYRRAEKIVTQLHDVLAKFSGRKLQSCQFFCNFSEDVALPAQDTLHTEIRTCNGNAIQLS